MKTKIFSLIIMALCNSIYSQTQIANEKIFSLMNTLKQRGLQTTEIDLREYFCTYQEMEGNIFIELCGDSISKSDCYKKLSKTKQLNCPFTFFYYYYKFSKYLNVKDFTDILQIKFESKEIDIDVYKVNIHGNIFYFKILNSIVSNEENGKICEILDSLKKTL